MACLKSEPFPHRVIDLPGFDPGPALACWPAISHPGWVRYDSPLERKSALNDVRALGRPLRGLLGWLLTLDVRGLLALGRRPVPDASLWGAGLHEMGRGDFLSLHLDADRHPVFDLERVANAVLFLGHWEGDWGGELELWDHRRTAPAVRVGPRPGRAVLWACGDAAYHSVAPVRCPGGEARRTLSVWWYARARGPSVRPRARFVAAGGPPDGLEPLRRERSGV